MALKYTFKWLRAPSQIRGRATTKYHTTEIVVPDGTDFEGAKDLLRKNRKQITWIAPNGFLVEQVSDDQLPRANTKTTDLEISQT